LGTVARDSDEITQTNKHIHFFFQFWKQFDLSQFLGIGYQNRERFCLFDCDERNEDDLIIFDKLMGQWFMPSTSVLISIIYIENFELKF
jgi:hypothetical protein